jgi:hypothetical protein
MDAIGSKHLAARCLIALALACCGLRAAHAAEPCSLATPPPTTWGQRVAAAACAEHRTWYSPFIDERGRLATMRISEAENARLQDNPISAWRRVVDYWKASGLMSLANGRPGAYECNVAVDVWPGSAACRSFVIDTPWSAVFVSFAYVRAGVPGFIPSASHFDFARGAIQNGGNSPFRFADPDVERPAPGDLMCFTRGLSTPMGSAAFRKYLERKGNPLAMHCDIVVAANAGGDGKLYTVGGNVLQGVTMRTLQLNQQGLIWALPRETGTPVDCRPSASAACNFDRQDWVVLLKLEPKASAPPPSAPQCCTVCTLPMPAGMKRCPVAGIEPVHPQPLQTTAPAEPAPSPEAPTETKRP